MQINLKTFLKDYNIEIPMLQRDYAQGRKSKENIAKDFLEKIFEVLKGESKNLHIDFIYGYSENGKFVLVDGQQRITTLWLIHFIIYKMNNIFDNDIKELLKNFSYSVRETSKKFCKNLIIKPLIISGNPKNIILNQGGIFGKDLDNDPTIKAILNMLDLIYIEASKLSEDELKNAVNNLDRITFSIFNMDAYDLGEELYIKMNARGKQLSLYENIKAYIQKGLDFEENFKLLSSIDNEWSDFFFDIKNINKFDNRGLIFLYYSALFFNLKSDKIKKEEELSNYLPNDVSKNIKYNFFDILKEGGNLKLLDNTIKILNKYKDKPLNNFVEKFDRKYLLNKDICYFYALLLFVSKIEDINSFDKKAFDDYYRICKHFIENHRMDEDEHVKGFFELFNRLSDGYDNIYKYLSEDKKGTKFHTEIYKLEKRKSKLILKNRENKDSKEKWEEILNKTSDNDFLVGWVNFLLDFSNDNFNKFKEYTELTINIIGKLNNDKFLNLFQRALLTFGDYGFYSTNYFYGNKPQINIFRDREAWNRILSGKKDKYNNKYFKELLDNLLKEANGSLEEKLESIINKVNFKDKEWFEYLLIKEEGLFEFITENGGAFKNCGRIRKFDKDMLLLKTVKTKKWAIDLLTYSFYLYLKNVGIDISNIEFSKLKYDKHSSKRNENSYFKINNKNVICDSINSKIQIGSKKYDINLSKGSDIFGEFDKILKKCKIIK